VSRSGGIAVLLPHREIYEPTGAGAVSLYVRDLCAASALAGRTTVLGAPVDAPFQGVSFAPVRSGSWLHGSRTARYLAGATRLIRRLQPALVEVHNRPRYIAPLRRRLPGMPLLLYLHNDPRGMKGLAAPPARAALLEQVDAVVCVSGYIRDCMLEGLAGHAGAGRVHAVLNGIDTDRCRPPADGAKRDQVLFVGRVNPGKGPLLFAQAAARALPGHPAWTAVLVGARWFRHPPRVSDYEQEVAAAMKGLGAQGEVTGYLTHDQVMQRFRDAAIAVVPSLWDEPCSLTALEAMASGCAVIATRRGGLPEVVDDAGVLLDDEEEATLAGALTALMDDPGRRGTLQRRARDRAEQVLDIHRAAANLDDIRRPLMTR